MEDRIRNLEKNILKSSKSIKMHNRQLSDNNPFKRNEVKEVQKSPRFNFVGVTLTPENNI